MPENFGQKILRQLTNTLAISLTENFRLKILRGLTYTVAIGLTQNFLPKILISTHMADWLIRHNSLELKPFAYRLFVLRIVTWSYYEQMIGGARGVMVTAVGNGHGDASSNPGRDWLHFTLILIPLGKVWIQLFSLQLWVNSRAV